MKRLASCIVLAFAPAISNAVYVSPDGMGQALIYPYYTVQSANGDAFNTYLSLVNHAADAKALRVRLRESRNGREVGQFNVYLAPNDTWTAALVPDSGGGARLVSSDVSCNGATGSPALSFALSTAAFTGANADGNGTDAARTKEGFVEVIEMASMADIVVVDAVSHGPDGVPNHCASVEPALTTSVVSPLRAPSGGLSGTLTLINVANGMNFTTPADALGGLASHPFFRVAPDSHVDFNAAEIDPVSVVVTDAATYRATWSRPADAVSAALMRYNVTAEFVLDAVTASRTEVVATFPTRHFYLSSGSSSMARPFTGKAGWTPDCRAGTAGPLGDGLYEGIFDREARGFIDDPRTSLFPEPPPPPLWTCASSAVLEVNRTFISAPAPATALLGSVSRGFSGFAVGGSENGSLLLGPYTDARMVSLPDSTRTDHVTGATTPGAQAYLGFPVLGFFARSFSNGTLSCASGSCMGNYGGAYPLQYVRKITAP